LDDNGFPLAAGWPADCSMQNRKQRRDRNRHAGRLAEINPPQRWLVPNVTSEAVAVRHAQVGQVARNNFSSPQSSDQASPFAALLDDGAGDLSPPPASPAPTPSTPPGPKAAPRPPDDHAASSSSDTGPSTQKSGDDATTGTQATGGAPPPSPAPQGDDATQAALALGALAKKAAKDANLAIDPSVVVAVTNSAPVLNAVATAASSTAAALIDFHTGDTTASDSSASDTSQAATPPADPTAGGAAPVAPQPVAVPVSLPVIPPAPVVSSDSGNDDPSGQDAAQIAALGDAVKAGALRADRTGADAAKGGSSAGDRTGDTAKLGAKAAAAPATPLLQPTDTQAPNGTGQRTSADGAQPGSTGGIPPAEAAANRARQRIVDSQASDSTTAPQDNAADAPAADPNAAAKPDAAASTGRIEDIVRQALDTTARRVEAATAEPTGGAPHPGGASADSAPQSPDGASGAIAPAALATAAAPTAATVTSPPPTAVPIAGLAVEIASHALAGKNRFEIRLDPPELGRIDVRLDVDRDGKVTSRLAVDRPETLDILRQDAPALERSLQQAGLKTADDALQFSLRDQGGFSGQNPYSSNNGSQSGAARAVIPDRELPAVDVAAAGYGRASGTSAGVDIRV
jgi:flagellar hook-length control protein FliK